MNLSDIPTPLTDAEVLKPVSEKPWTHLVTDTFARDLERKLAESVADAKASEMMLRQVCEERDQLRSYAGSQTFRSDFRTADELRAAYDAERAKNAVLREALNRMVAANSGVAVMPTKEAREENAALANARAALTTTEEKA